MSVSDRYHTSFLGIWQGRAPLPAAAAAGLDADMHFLQMCCIRATLESARITSNIRLMIELFAGAVVVGLILFALPAGRRARERKLGGTITNIGFGGDTTISTPRKFRH